MFGNINRLGNKDRKIEVLAVSSHHDEYLISLSKLPNLEISVHGKWQEDISKTPENIRIIRNTGLPHGKYFFDYLLCFGQAQNVEVSNRLKHIVNCPLIHIRDSSEQTGMVHPFGMKPPNSQDIQSDQVVYIRSYASTNNSQNIIPKMINVRDLIEKDPESICFFGNTAQHLINTYVNILKPYKHTSFSTDNLTKSEIFLDTTVGVSTYSELALEYGCKIVAPYSLDMESFAGDSCFLYNGFEELEGAINRALESKIDKFSILQKSSEGLLSENDFIKEWERILR